MRPFKYGCVVYGDNFCGRKETIEVISDYIHSAQNIVLQGERRIGKTSLIVETARYIKKRKLLKVDMGLVKSSHDLCQRIVKSVVRFEEEKNILSRVIKGISHLRPQLGIDPLTNYPTISIDSAKVSGSSIEEILDIFEKLNNKNDLVVFFDEFQDILSIPDAMQIVSTIRSKIQYHDTIPYIFTGSIRNKMDELFNNPNSPLFKSAIPISIEPINTKDFCDFIKAKFSYGNKKITDSVINQILDYCEGITGDIQQMCDAIWDISEDGDLIDEKIFPKALELIFAREQRSYEQIISDLTEIQIKCLTGISQTGGEYPNSTKFLKLTGITQPSTVNKALTKLKKMQVIFKVQKRYRFVNPFFKIWFMIEYL